MQMIDKTAQISTLIDKAAEARDSGDAMRFSQAAANAANALCGVWAAMRPVPMD